MADTTAPGPWLVKSLKVTALSGSKRDVGESLEKHRSRKGKTWESRAEGRNDQKWPSVLRIRKKHWGCREDGHGVRGAGSPAEGRGCSGAGSQGPSPWLRGLRQRSPLRGRLSTTGRSTYDNCPDRCLWHSWNKCELPIYVSQWHPSPPRWSRKAEGTVPTSQRGHVLLKCAQPDKAESRPRASTTALFAQASAALGNSTHKENTHMYLQALWADAITQALTLPLIQPGLTGGEAKRQDGELLQGPSEAEPAYTGTGTGQAGGETPTKGVRLHELSTSKPVTTTTALCWPKIYIHLLITAPMGETKNAVITKLFQFGLGRKNRIVIK